jgi:hypothetical protein
MAASFLRPQLPRGPPSTRPNLVTRPAGFFSTEQVLFGHDDRHPAPDAQVLKSKAGCELFYNPSRPYSASRPNLARFNRICELRKDRRIGTTGLPIGLGRAQTRKPACKHVLFSKQSRLEEFRNLLVNSLQFLPTSNVTSGPIRTPNYISARYSIWRGAGPVLQYGCAEARHAVDPLG